MKTYSAFALLLLTSSMTAFGEETKVDSCDVTWLWPIPKDATEVDQLINMDDLKDSDGKPVWSDQVFGEFLKIAESPAAAVKGSNGVRQISMRDAFRKRETWKVVGFRIDPAAPGGHGDITAAFGEKPQIRLIVQPVTVSGGTPTIHDFAGHLVFSYPSETEAGKPDRKKFLAIVEDILALKKKCADNGAKTAGAKLGIHPGLTGSVAGLTADVQAMLKKHLQTDKLMSMALMGLPAGPEPWIFIAMFRRAATDPFGPAPIPVFTDPDATDPASKFKTAQMLSFLDRPRVAPDTQTDNRNPITKNFSVPITKRRGVSTAPLFENADPNAAADFGRDASGTAVADPDLNNKDIPDHIANPQLSHFFNTDCMSCHTESQRRKIGGFGPGKTAFKWPSGVASLDDSVRQNERWNVRNQGWFPDFFGGGKAREIISQRTANETAEVVEFINEKYLSP